MLYRSLLITLGLITLLPSCGSKYTRHDDAHYVRRAWTEQERDKKNAKPPPEFDEPTTDKFTIDVGSEVTTAYPRYPWETVDQWLDRMRDQLVLNHQRITVLRSRMAGLDNDENQITRAMQAAIARNELLRTRLGELQQQDPGYVQQLAYQEQPSNIPTPTFQVHLVQKGETLSSIARHYYNDQERVHDILMWNQGWIRNPDEIIAGLAIILFDEDAPERNEQVVEEYIGRYPEYQ